MQADLGHEGAAKGAETITRHTFTKEKQPEVMSELLYHKPNQPSQQDHARVILNWLQIKAEELLAEEQAGFRPDRSTDLQ